MKIILSLFIIALFTNCSSNQKPSSIQVESEEFVNDPLLLLARKFENNEQVDDSVTFNFAKDPLTRRDLFYLLEKYQKQNLFPAQYYSFEKAAESHLINWLVYPTELDTIPSEISLFSREELKEADSTFTYYVFKFKTKPPHWAAKDGWMLGCVGPYKHGDDPFIWPGATFSRLSKIEEVSPKQEVIWTHRHIYRGIDD